MPASAISERIARSPERLSADSPWQGSSSIMSRGILIADLKIRLTRCSPQDRVEKVGFLPCLQGLHIQPSMASARSLSPGKWYIPIVS
jgi:hypothetical protein